MLRMRKNANKYNDIPDIDEILEDAFEDTNQDFVEERKVSLYDVNTNRNSRNDDNLFEEHQYNKKSKSPKIIKTKTAKIQHKGKRVIHIKELDPDIIPPSMDLHPGAQNTYEDPDHTGSKIVIIGKPGVGKSSLIKSIAWEKSPIFPCAEIYSGTEDANAAYSKTYPSTFIYNKFSQVPYTEFVKRQKTAKSYLENPWCLCVMDDVSDDVKFFNLPVMRGTYKNGRHWKMLHILALQYCVDLPKSLRSAIDYTFLLREANLNSRKSLYENFAGVIDDFSDFCQIMDTITVDYNSLVICNRTVSNSVEDCLFYYKARADVPRDFKFGCQEYWDFHRQRYNQNYVNPLIG